MTFQYKVRDPLGKIHEGELDAASQEDATQMLRSEGFQVLNLEEEEELLNLLPRKITKNDIIYVSNQLAIMVDTGIPLSSALEGICSQEENPALKKLLLEIKSRVEGGEDFSTALSAHPKYFDKTYVSLVKASEQTGSLGEMLDRIAEYLRKELDTRNKVRAALAYPTVMMGLAASVTIFLLTFVMPKFAPLFSRKGVKLPKPTLIMMSVSQCLIEYWWAWLIGVTALVVGYLVFRTTQTGRKCLDWTKIRLPILGTMFRKVIISRSIRTLGTMIGSGVSMLDAIKLSAEVSGNYYYERAWKYVLEEITKGNRISDSLAGNDLFPSTLVQMIGAGEETGKLDYVLDKVSVYYDREVENSLKTATSLIEPIMITVMGIVVGGIAMSLLLPIFSLSRMPG